MTMIAIPAFVVPETESEAEEIPDAADIAVVVEVKMEVGWFPLFWLEVLRAEIVDVVKVWRIAPVVVCIL